MKTKRMLALGLVSATLCGMLTFPASATTATAPFTDIADSQVAASAQLLSLLGIVNGTGGGLFQPDRALTRAEFTKMAVEVMGNGDEALTQMNRTIFKDVPSTHWARGYINIAIKGSEETPGILRGDAYGNFAPDRPITYAEAVTILMRILGYTDNSVGYGVQWYDGYLITAGTIGLLDGLTLDAEGTMTRGQTALLLDNFLHTPSVGQRDDYMVTAMGCTTVTDALILDTNATSADGTTGSIEVADGQTYKTDRTPFSSDLVGYTATLVLNGDQKVLSVEPTTLGTTKAVGILSCSYTGAKVTGGETIAIPTDTVVWKNNQATTYQNCYLDLMAGTQAVFQYSATNELSYIFLKNAQVDGSTVVLGSNPTIEAGYAIYKNGVPATSSDLRRYDVATYDKASGVVYVSDLRLTGIYENVFPSPLTPATVTILGQKFPVLTTAIADLQDYQIGDKMTLLLTHDGQVAGAVSGSTASSNVVGIVTELDSTSGEATVSPLSTIYTADGAAVTFTGKTSYTGNAAATMVGQLVTVSSSKADTLTLTPVSGTTTSSTLDMSKRTIGSVALSDNVIFYERVGGSKPIAIEESQITVDTIPGKQIAYYHTDYAGRADVVLLDNVTGDGFEYGFSVYTVSPNGSDSIGGNTVTTKPNPDTVAVKNGNQTEGGTGYGTGVTYGQNLVVGVIPSLALSRNNQPMLEKLVTLQSVTKVSSTAFRMDEGYVRTSAGDFPISQNVQCYSKVTKDWFNEDGTDPMDALAAARAYAETLTLYFDRAPEEGGKIRLVVVEK